MTGIWNQEWLNMNSQRAYPLAEDATRLDESGTFLLPDDFLLELYLPVHAGLDVRPDRFFVRSVAVYPTGCNVAIGYDADELRVVASAVIARTSHREYDSYALPGSGDFDDTLGKVVIGRFDSIDAQPSGQFFFTFDGGKLDPDCIRPIIRGVSSITVVNGGERSPRLYGDFEFIAGTNTRISVVNVGIVNQIRWDAIDGAGLTETCACEDAPGPPIRTIDNIPPDANGNFTIVGDECLQLEPIGNGLKLNDRCSQPCCGCVELEKLTRELDRFGDEATTLRTFVTRLQVEFSSMQNVILASRLNLSGCSSC
jgi:hypothetical protein